jgi:hypothetical protein
MPGWGRWRKPGRCRRIFWSEWRGATSPPNRWRSSTPSLGEKDQAFAWLEKAYEAKSGWLATSLMTFPDYDPLRSDPRFPALLMKMGLARRAVGSRSGSRAYPRNSATHRYATLADSNLRMFPFGRIKRF